MDTMEDEDVRTHTSKHAAGQTLAADQVQPETTPTEPLPDGALLGDDLDVADEELSELLESVEVPLDEEDLQELELEADDEDLVLSEDGSGWDEIEPDEAEDGRVSLRALVQVSTSDLGNDPVRM